MPVSKRLNFEHLLYFWSVVRTGSLAKACRLSATDHQLAVGEKLLVKSGRRLGADPSIPSNSEIGTTASP